MKSYNLNEKDIIRFLSKITKTHNCWIPDLKKRKDGYSVFTVKSTNEYLGHRLSYCIFNGPLIEGMVIDHTCRNKSCCNPDHLRQVTQQVNALENNISILAQNKQKTHCKRGHQFSEENTYREKNSMGRVTIIRRCKICRASEQRKNI